MNEDIKKRMYIKDNYLSIYACKDIDAIRIKKQPDDFRTPFFRDIDRIIYSLSYNRYIDKTQVFPRNDNDHISKRITHVQMVSKIARTIGRALGLNEDLIEAASLGHDLGHVPFGHYGEKILNKISLEHNEGYFNHNVQSVRLLMNIEHNGLGNDLCLQTLDAILCHNGEIESRIYKPVKKNIDEFFIEYNGCYEDKSVNTSIVPMTLEGCVVRISDIISYVGKDVEDAILMNIVKREDLPDEVKNVLGDNNSKIVNSLVVDIIKNSFNKPYIMMSNDVFNALSILKNFNYKNIYEVVDKIEDEKNYTVIFNELFNCLLYQVNNHVDADIYNVFLSQMNTDYNENTTSERKVIDYIAGMTDDYLISQYNKYCK